MDLKNNPELIPLIDWWEKDGKSTVICLLVAAIAVGGFYGWKNHRIAVRNAAAESLATVRTTEEIEAAVSKFGGSATGGALKLRLAKSYYDAGRYEEALDQYGKLIGNAPDGFEAIPVVGQAQCLEALGKFDEAAKAYDDFAVANPTNYLTLTAQLGLARCCAQQGDKEKALAQLAALKDANKDDEIAKARVEAIEELVKRYEKKTVVAVAPAAEAQK